MKTHHDNHLLFRRFMLVTSCIALMGVLLANMFEANDRINFTVYDRAKEWREFETPKCRDNLCALSVANNLTT